jgi:uncharacterized protein
MKEIILSKKEASNFLLWYHDLHTPAQQKGEEAILAYFRKVGCIQFDPLNIVARNPDLVLQARIKGYTPAILENLLYQKRCLVDGWDKMMSIYPTEDRPFMKRVLKERGEVYRKHYPKVVSHLPRFLEDVRRNGPLSSIHLKGEEKINWAWNPTKVSRAALEALFFSGEILVSHRINSRRLFDLAERLLPPEIRNAADPHKTLEEYREWHILRRISSIGLAAPKAGDFWHGIASTKMKEIREILPLMEEKGKICRVYMESADSQVYYSPSEKIQEYMASKEKIVPSGTALLAPLDNMMWDRKLIKDLFDFDYTWEVYKPAKLRDFGYYVLPILYDGRLIGRCEPITDRKNKKVLLKNWWFEPGIDPDDEMRENLKGMLYQFCRFLGMDRIVTAPTMNRRDRSWLKGISV